MDDCVIWKVVSLILIIQTRIVWFAEIHLQAPPSSVSKSFILSSLLACYHPYGCYSNAAINDSPEKFSHKIILLSMAL